MRWVIVTLSVVALSRAAIADTRIVSASATSRAEPHDWVLADEQVQLLDTWLKGHRKGWRSNLATPPKPALSIQIKQSDGTERSIEFFDQPGWANFVVVHGRVASFSQTEIASLRRTLGERNDE